VLVVVPDTNPVEERLNPGGSISCVGLTGVMLKEYGPVPPAAVNCAAKGTPV
jgi:hypothetical protein